MNDQTKIKSYGFTLIELLVVIAIVGILSSVVLMNLNGARARSRDVKRIADVKSLQLALELYFDNNRSYPATLSVLTAAPTYISPVPTPPEGGSYVYRPITIGGTCNSYHLGAVLEQSTSAELLTDADPPTGSVCSGAADFSGVSTDCGTGSGAERCFDVAP
ncbi:MAG: prepilin-type N-terminal cleavage/methylation domain-containing protein [Patescibacteria group bacterium]